MIVQAGRKSWSKPVSETLISLVKQAMALIFGKGHRFAMTSTQDWKELIRLDKTSGEKIRLAGGFVDQGRIISGKFPRVR
jgi:hypothetical protein